MFTSFSTALSALNATSTAIDVVGNNLANLNSPGFKTSALAFRDLVTQSLGAGLGETQVGFGVGQPLTIRQFTQGAIQTSAGLLDAAIQGDGFFVLKTASGNASYTRAGNFVADKEGNLLTDTGDRVQGWTTLNPATGAVDTNGAIGNIIVPVGSLRPPTTTTSMTVDFNLDSTAASDTTSTKTIPLTVIDSLGGSHVLTLNFQKTGPNQWTYGVTVPGEDIAGGTPGTPVDTGATGTLTFDTNGKLTDPAAGSPIAITVAGLADGASDMNVSWGLYNTDGTARVTQFAQPSESSASSQNGKTAGQLVRVGLADGGGILAGYSNGDQVIVGQVAMASVRNPDTLLASGNNSFQLSALTATPAVGTPGTGGRGQIVGASIEASTVDIAREFTNLIVYQRSYEANSKVIQTSDQLSQDTINLIR
jgi:flagellar hook protein FlgE